MTPLNLERIFLTGYMGAGKSTIGRLLARQVGYRFYDTDQLMIRGFGKPISRIFRENGEESFRKAEVQVIHELASRRKGFVASTGGGTLVREETMGPALAHGTVIYLRAPIELLYERVIFSPKDRPILSEPDTEHLFREKFHQREAFYEQAHLVVDTEGRPSEEVVGEIVRRLGFQPGLRGSGVFADGK